MQFLSAVRSPEFAGEAAAGVHLPYSHMVDDHTLALRDGSLMQVIRIDGLMFETVESETLNHRKDMRDAMLRALGSSRFAVYHHILRRRVEPELAGEFPDDFSRGLDAAWRERLAARRLYANDMFITVLRRPAPVRGLWRRGGAQPDDARALEAGVEQVLASLASYGARRLGVYDTRHGPCGEVLEFLSALCNAELGPVLLPHGDVGHHLPRHRLSFGQDTLQLGARYGAMVSIKDYPGQTTPGMLDDLLRLPFAMTVGQSFAFVDRTQSLGRMNMALRRMRAADEEAISLREELAQAKDDVAAGRACFGEHHLSVQVMGDDQAEVDAGVAEVLAALGDLGLVAVREDVGMEPAFWAQFPGNFAYIPRRALIGSANFAAFASGHGFPRGRARDNVWGDAVALFETTAAGPYHFNFHPDGGDLGNFTVIGPSGSGKTVITNFLLAQARRHDPRLILFDKDRSAEIFIRAMGGVYEAMRPGMPSGLNPLRLADTAANRGMLVEWLGALAGGLRDAAEKEAVEEAISANYLAPPELRRLRHFAPLLRGGARPMPDDLAARLRPWWGDGQHAWMFDNAGADSLDLDRDVIGIDMTQVLDHPALRTPLMMALFHQVEARLDGRPTIIVVDEGWKALDDPVFAARLRDWLKTLRKRGAILGFVTQNAEDALASRIAGAIVEQTATQIFTANPKARAQDYVDGFGLTAHEFELVRAMPEAARCFLVKQGGQSVVLRLALNGGARWLTVLSGRESHVRRLDGIRAEVGDDPACWMPRLLGDG